MKPLKHSKFKNTGVLFELLVRQVASDTLNNVDSKSIPILKKYFSKSTELAKELELYQTLVKERFANEEKAKALIEAVLSARVKLNQSALNRQKYNLIKEIKSTYVLEDFFKSKINNYKVLAAAFKLFEFSVADNPTEIITNKYTLIEHITSKQLQKTKLPVTEVSAFTKQDKDVRLLAYKILVDKFNAKYSALNESQKNLLRQYINNVSDSSELRDFLTLESAHVRKALRSLTAKVSDKVTKIKLTEVTNLLKQIESTKSVKDSHVLNLLRYHELIKELNKI
jgi:hypothetical protein